MGHISVNFEAELNEQFICDLNVLCVTGTSFAVSIVLCGQYEAWSAGRLGRHEKRGTGKAAEAGQDKGKEAKTEIGQQQPPFNGLCSGTTRVGRYQKKHSAFCLSIGLCCVQAGFAHLLSSGFLWSRGRQWRQTHRQSGWAPPQPDQWCSHPTTNPRFFTGRMPFLLPSQQCQSTESTRLK